MRLIFVVAGACCFAVSARAQVRRAPAVADIAAPSAGLAQTLFGEDGYFRIAGGVVLGGRARFLVERDGVDTPVDAGAVTPVGWPGGNFALRYDGQTYPLRTQAGLACPLGRFIERDGVVAYTVPRFLDDRAREAMIRAGIAHHRIASEFVGSGFERLLHAADFGATTPLPDPVAGRLIDAMNDNTGLSGYALRASYQLAGMVGSILNTDSTTLYRAYLLPGADQVQIAGVPLRYFWAYDNGAAGIFAVSAYAENWPAGTRLTDARVAPSQYDVVNFYQVAGVMRQLHQDHPKVFAAAVATACSD